MTPLITRFNHTSTHGTQREEGGSSAIFSGYVDPGYDALPKVGFVLGVIPHFFRQQGMAVGAFEAVWAELAAWLDGVSGGLPVVLVGHNTVASHKMLTAALERCGLVPAQAFRPEEGGGGPRVVGMVDTPAVFRTGELGSREEGDGRPPRPPSFKQAALFQHLFGRALPSADEQVGRLDVVALGLLSPMRWSGASGAGTGWRPCWRWAGGLRRWTTWWGGRWSKRR